MTDVISELGNTSRTPPLPRLYCAYKLPLSQELRCDLRGRLFECCLFSLWCAGFLSQRCMLAMSPTKWYAKKKTKKPFTCRQLIGHALWQTALIYSDMPGLSHNRHPYAAPLNHEAVKLGCTPTSFKIFFFSYLSFSVLFPSCFLNSISVCKICKWSCTSFWQIVTHCDKTRE